MCSSDLAQALNSHRGDGAVISSVEPNSPAARAGLAKGDIVTAVNGTPVKSAAQLRNAIGLSRVGQEVELAYERKGVSLTARARIEAGPRTAARPSLRQ